MRLHCAPLRDDASESVRWGVFSEDTPSLSVLSDDKRITSSTIKGALNADGSVAARTEQGELDPGGY